MTHQQALSKLQTDMQLRGFSNCRGVLLPAITDKSRGDFGQVHEKCLMTL
ncbi:MAG: hypothetical protein HQ557_03915 [Bacteroidetes bacterium]|nr:hypothetical protein [Bacteroidota bacterium]